MVCGIGAIGVLGAITKRIAGGSRHRGLGAAASDPGPEVRQLATEVDALRDEVTGLRRELDEAQNRLDFTERLLGQARERGLLNAPKER